MSLRCARLIECSLLTRIPHYIMRFKFISQSRGIASRLLWQPLPDFEYLNDPRNESEIESNIKARKGIGCIRTLKKLVEEHENASPEVKPALWAKLVSEGLKIPNRSDPRLSMYGESPAVVEAPGEQPTWSFEPKEFHVLAKNLDLLRTENLGNLTGHRSYYFIKELALLEQALIRYTVDVLMKKGFTLYSVPDLLHSALIEGCGMDTHSERTQVRRMMNPTFKNLPSEILLEV